MKADLANSWIMMAILPNVVKDEVINKYVACLLGDEIADNREFAGMMVNGWHYPAGDGCRFNFNGTCYHPFRPGSMMSAILAMSFRGERNAKGLVKDEIYEVMDDDNRRCRHCGCCLSIPGYREMEDSAFLCVERFYEELFERAGGRSLYGRTYMDFRKVYARGIDEKGFFLDCSHLKEYEPNIRRHFDEMMKSHFDLISDAIDRDSMSIEDKKGKSCLGKAIMKVRLDLVMHSRNYWAQEKYKDSKEESNV